MKKVEEPEAIITITVPDGSTLEEVDNLAKSKGFSNMEEMLTTELNRQIATYRKKTLGGDLWL